MSNELRTVLALGALVLAVLFLLLGDRFTSGCFGICAISFAIAAIKGGKNK